MSGVSLPQKKYYRQRAHANPRSDHDLDYPSRPDEWDWQSLYQHIPEGSPGVEFLDVGCGYGGLLIALSKAFPDRLSLGLEIRVKVSDYVRDRIAALRAQEAGSFGNVGCLRSNAMKHLPQMFRRGQLSKMFFLFPDPHFKKAKHKWRIITTQLLDEYAYVLREGGRLYTITDVEDLHDWMRTHLESHPLFQPLSEAELAGDEAYKLLFTSTEEGNKVTRNQGLKLPAVFQRIPDPFTSSPPISS